MQPSARRLEHRIEALDFGASTAVSGNTLVVSRSEAERVIGSPALSRVHLDIARPGESVRIVKVLDAVEPRTSASGIFPGILGPPTLHASEVHVLRGVAVVTAGYLPRAQEALVDMAGPAAGMSPLSERHCLVVEFSPAQNASWKDVDVALRLGLLRLAGYLAEAAQGSPDEVTDLAPATRAGDRPGMPLIGAVTNVQTQGNFKDVFVYGRSFANAHPSLIDPNALELGAVVSGQFGHPALKNPTILYQNHPVVDALRRRDGRDIAFGGLILCPEPVEQSEKELMAAQTALLCERLGWSGAIVTKEGGGNADADVALKMDALEDAGITAAGLFAELAGADGTGPPLVVTPERATLTVSTGNYDERIALDAVERALGGDRFDLLDADATDAMIVPSAVIYAALSPLGWGRLSCSEAAA